ncbi:hypothetical protein QTG54_003360 [Skeletonema marinoi]|uniref:J domain-containing protein n=1 Tax=Skeletonema marinoi TaxID=267567 RepID=A0AAD9DF77_9STRA|nr:hypothetical protein QTG54_003360 [Skeletonema marinoi]
MSTQIIGNSVSFSNQRSSAKAAAMANLAAKRKMRNAARFENRQQQQRQPPSASRNSKIDTRQADDPVGIDASTAYKLEERRVKAEKEIAGVGNEALILVYGYNANLYEDVFALSSNSSIRDIKRSYQEQTSQLEQSLTTVFASDVPDDEINAALTYSQMQAAISCGMISAHMEQMHPRNFMEVKMDALKRAFDILKDEQSRIEYDAVLLEFQESSREKLAAVVEVEDEDDSTDRENEDYSYEDTYTYTDEDESNEDEDKSDSVDTSAAETAPHDDEEPKDVDSYPQSPPQALTKHPWKQEQFQEQHSPRDPFDFDQQFYQSSMPEESDCSIVTSRSTRSVHVGLFDPFDLQGADQINFHHLPMVDQFIPEEDDSVYTEEDRQDKNDDETVTVFQYPLPEVDDEEDDEDDITVGEVIQARERGEEVVLPQRTTTNDDYPNMVDFVPRKKKGIKPKLLSMYQSVKRSVGGSSKGSRSIASDSAEFQPTGVRVMSLLPPKKNDDYDDEPPQARSETIVTSIDPQGPNLSAEESDDDEETESSEIHSADSDNDDDIGDYDDGSVLTDIISELTRDTFPQQQQRTTLPPKTQPQQEVVSSNTDLEVETFLNMANNFRAMEDEASDTSQTSEDTDNELLYNSSDRNTSMMAPKQKNGRTVSANDSLVSTDTKDDYLKHYPMKSLVSIDDEESYDGDKTGVESILDEWIGVIDEIEEMFDDSLESISSVCSYE